ncbi:MAG: hypothetical protein AB7F64_05065 [Gammaproteobacteria bacterium]
MSENSVKYKEGEQIQVEGSNLLTFLLLAKNLSSYEENADELILEYFPEYCNNGYVDWVALEELLIHLAEIEHWTKDPAEAANELFKQCLE